MSTFDPHHFGARHHHFTGRGVAEFEHRLDHPPFVVGHHTALLRQVDDLTQLDLGRERAVAEAAARRQRVTDQHQQPADRGEHHRNRLQRKRSQQRDGIGVLPAERPGTDTDRDETDDRHDRRCRDETPADPEVVVEEGRQQDGRAYLAGDSEQHTEVDEAWPLGHHPGESHGTGAFVANEFLDPGYRDGTDRRIGRREEAGYADQDDRADQLTKVVHGSSKNRDLSSNRRSFSD